jgi:hypothetical protein
MDTLLWFRWRRPGYGWRENKRRQRNSSSQVQPQGRRQEGVGRLICGWPPTCKTDGYHPYKSAIRDAFGNRVAHGTIQSSAWSSPPRVSEQYDALATPIPSHLAALLKQLETQEGG